ncbi:transposase [Sphingomonas sp. CJ20]
MGKPNFSEAFQRDAVAQITDRRCPVAEVYQRLGVSQHLMYAWNANASQRRSKTKTFRADAIRAREKCGGQSAVKAKLPLKVSQKAPGKPSRTVGRNVGVHLPRPSKKTENCHFPLDDGDPYGSPKSCTSIWNKTIISLDRTYVPS